MNEEGDRCIDWGLLALIFNQAHIMLGQIQLCGYDMSVIYGPVSVGCLKTLLWVLRKSKMDVNLFLCIHTYIYRVWRCKFIWHLVGRPKINGKDVCQQQLWCRKAQHSTLLNLFVKTIVKEMFSEEHTIIYQKATLLEIHQYFITNTQGKEQKGKLNVFTSMRII